MQSQVLPGRSVAGSSCRGASRASPRQCGRTTVSRCPAPSLAPAPQPVQHHQHAAAAAAAAPLAQQHHQRHHHQHPTQQQRAASVRAAATPPAGSSHGAACPSPAETARTVADLSREGVLCSNSAEAGTPPLGTPVGYVLDKEGNATLAVAAGSPEAANLERSPACTLLVQPTAHPARGVASVALQGAAALAEDQGGASDGTRLYRLVVERAVYYGGLDQATHGLVIDGDAYRAAEPDLLRGDAAALINTWNSERAEDIYRIVAGHLGLPLDEMLYAELLWIDRLGIYVRTEALGRNPQVVRVPFYRPVLDERDARSVLTMGSHISWEDDKRRGGSAYVPPPIAPAPAAAASSN